MFTKQRQQSKDPSTGDSSQEDRANWDSLLGCGYGVEIGVQMLESTLHKRDPEQLADKEWQEGKRA